jgi:Recombination endonuclease VII
MKICKACGAAKQLDEYYANPSGRDGTRPECKDCTRARRKRWYLENREREIQRVLAWQVEHPEMVRARMDAFRAAGKKKVSDRKSRLKRKYGLTLEGFDALLESQGGGCAICGRPDVDNVDHDHATGRVRGILCFKCNVAIGLIDEDSDRARAAGEYLDRDDEMAEVARGRAVALAG